MADYNKLLDFTSNLKCKVLENEPLLKYTSFKIGGPADIFIEILDLNSLQQIIKYVSKNQISTFVLGNGSNLLVSDLGVRGVVLKLGGDFNKISICEDSDNCINCGAGVSLAKVCVFAMQHSLSGLEFSWGIPGSCGGAIFMNAGAYGGEMVSVIESCEYISNDGNLHKLYKEDMELSYRHSIFSHNDGIVTSIRLKLEKDNKEKIRERMHDYISRRKSKQPVDYPSAGSIFKRPGNGYYAAALIDQAGLKGYKIGGAMISPKHAGFIVNDGGATCKDVLKLIEIIKEKVFKNSGIMLECEVKIIGDFK